MREFSFLNCWHIARHQCLVAFWRHWRNESLASYNLWWRTCICTWWLTSVTGNQTRIQQRSPRFWGTRTLCPHTSPWKNTATTVGPQTKRPCTWSTKGIADWWGAFNLRTWPPWSPSCRHVTDEETGSRKDLTTCSKTLGGRNSSK